MACRQVPNSFGTFPLRVVNSESRLQPAAITAEFPTRVWIADIATQASFLAVVLFMIQIHYDTQARMIRSCQRLIIHSRRVLARDKPALVIHTEICLYK